MRRLWWLGAGYAAGLGTAAWVRSKARQTAERYAPANVRSAVADRSKQAAQRAQQTAADSARNLGREARRIAEDIKHAVAEGRETMHDTESELRDDDVTGPDSGARDR
ncbi:MAG: hypothetical protein OXC06_00405 [Acidimicrobiaceae bacterium]|nr:hypothetical protein [Acidimicrobiaceae bacterium]